ncbi:MAG: pirin family protein [Planctomycetota bacterium]
MITHRPGTARGRFDHGWLRTAHTFSFADYVDPAHMGFRSLRVINEDHIAAGQGFGTHPHRDMEILTWVLDGALAHEDSMGHGATLRPGEVQVMSAGTGILHSEFNASDGTDTHLLQIWLLPERRGLEPRYDQKAVDPASMQDRLAHLAGPPGAGAVVDLHQDAHLYVGRLGAGAAVEHALAEGRGAWVQVARGRVRLGELQLQQGDGAALEGEAAVRLTALEPAEVLVFDLG